VQPSPETPETPEVTVPPGERAAPERAEGEQAAEERAAEEEAALRREWDARRAAERVEREARFAAGFAVRQSEREEQTLKRDSRNWKAS
jgi:hypothetical protein